MKKKPNKTTTDLVPRGVTVLIERIYEEQETTGGIIIAEVTKEPRPVGIVIAVGPLCKSDLQEGIGKRVYFNKYANLEVVDGFGKTFMMMDDVMVYCFLTEKTIVMDASATKEKRINIEKN